MKKTMDDFINPTNEKNGLLIADMPTGFGKTYNAARSMENYINNSDSIFKKKIRFHNVFIGSLDFKKPPFKAKF